MTEQRKSRIRSALIFFGLQEGDDFAIERVRTPRNHQEKSGEFYLKEYEFLRREIEITIQSARALERNVVVAIGISIAWLFHERQAVPRWAWLFPCLFAMLGAIRAFGNFRLFSAMARYLGKVELAFSEESDPGGWQHFASRSWNRISVLAFWSLLIFATLAVTLYELTHG